MGSVTYYYADEISIMLLVLSGIWDAVRMDTVHPDQIINIFGFAVMIDLFQISQYYRQQ